MPRKPAPKRPRASRAKPASEPASQAAELTTAQAAALLGMTPRALQYHVKTGRITPTRVVEIERWKMNYFARHDVEQLGQELRPDGKPGKGKPRKTDAD